MTATVTVLVTLEDAGACVSCGTHFAMEAALKRQKLRDYTSFYCPNGHSQVYTAEHEEVRLRRLLDAERAAKERAEDLAKRRQKELDNARLTVRMTSGKLRALRQRVSNGVCPCCHRSFVQLARHMRTKHPAFVETEARAKREIDDDNG